MAASGSFFVAISCVICEYHVLQRDLEPLECFDEDENVHDRKAVAVPILHVRCRN